MSFFCFIYIHIWTYKDRFGVFNLWLSGSVSCSCAASEGATLKIGCVDLLEPQEVNFLCVSGGGGVKIYF